MDLSVKKKLGEWKPELRFEGNGGLTRIWGRDLPNFRQVPSSFKKKILTRQLFELNFLLHQFLHPGLSPKKILVSKEGRCKLYDFCLAEDARKRIVLMKSKVRMD